MKCPECGSGKIARHMREVSCAECGFVLDDNLFMGS
jgi:transcription initiation factor TFIIIB Brf1 subunit/transcription initiation factor TFIIB